jgi:hypothetical protein
MNGYWSHQFNAADPPNQYHLQNAAGCNHSNFLATGAGYGMPATAQPSMSPFSPSMPLPSQAPGDSYQSPMLPLAQGTALLPDMPIFATTTESLLTSTTAGTKKRAFPPSAAAESGGDVAASSVQSSSAAAPTEAQVSLPKRQKLGSNAGLPATPGSWPTGGAELPDVSSSSPTANSVGSYIEQQDDGDSDMEYIGHPNGAESHVVIELNELVPTDSYDIAVGSVSFKLTGASLSSDGKLSLYPNTLPLSDSCYADSEGPSYLTQRISERIRAGTQEPLLIDRDHETFRDIVLHLQGYRVTPRNAEHFERLFTDSIFYSRKPACTLWRTGC